MGMDFCKMDVKSFVFIKLPYRCKTYCLSDFFSNEFLQILSLDHCFKSLTFCSNWESCCFCSWISFNIAGIMYLKFQS